MADIASSFAFSAALACGPAKTEAGGVAYFAHIGGFIAGVVLSFVFRDSSRLASRA